MLGSVKRLLGKPRVTSVIVAVVIVIALAVVANSDDDAELQPTRTASPGQTGANATSETTGLAGTRPTGGASSTRATERPGTTLSPDPQTEIPREQLAPGGGGKAATALSASPSCTPERGGTAQLRWSVAAQRGVAQRVAVTQYADGFETQRFSMSHDLSADTGEYVWPGGLEPGVQYRWEVLTRHGDTYTRSATATFRGADCLADS